MARKVRQLRRKRKNIDLVSVPVSTAPDVATRVALIQALIPVALERVQEAAAGRLRSGRVAARRQDPKTRW